MTADTDRRMVYAAEDLMMAMMNRGGTAEIAGSTITIPVERKFGNIDNVRDYVDRLHTVFGADLPAPTVRVRKGQTKAHYEAGTNTIAVPDRTRWALREAVVLHEFAHYLAWQRHRASGHGPLFRAEYRDLLANVIAPEAGFMFTVLYAV